jgi:hypothetical protein
MISNTRENEFISGPNARANARANAQLIQNQAKTIPALIESMKRDANNPKLIRKILLNSGIIGKDGQLIHREMSGQR